MPVITGLYAGLTAILQVVLAFRVVGFRRKEHAGLGDNDNREFQTAIRAHANLVENASVFLIVMLIAEMNHFYIWALHAVGIIFILARLIHCRGFFKTRGGYSKGRFYGTALTWSLILVLGIYNMARYGYLVFLGGVG